MFLADGDDAKDPAWEFLLRHLAEQLNTSEAKIDAAVSNPTRGSRVPFVRNRKGDDTADRPHRVVRVLSYPETFEAVTSEQVRELADKNGYEDQEEISGNSEYELLVDAEGLERWINEYSDHLQLLAVRQKGPETHFVLDSCPIKGDRHRGHKPVIILHPHGNENAIGFHCFSSDCDGKTFGDLRNLLEEETGHVAETRLWKAPAFDYSIFDRHAELWGSELEIANDPIPGSRSIEEVIGDLLDREPPPAATPAVQMVDYNERLYHKRILQGPLRHKACILTHFYQETSRRDANCLSQADDMIDPHLTAKHEAFRASVEEIIQREDYDAMKKMLPTDVSMYLTFEGPEPLNEAACGLSQEDVLHFFDLNPAMSVQTFETSLGQILTLISWLRPRIGRR